MSNQWVEFVRKWAKKHNQTYMCAASKQKCRDAYHAAYPKNKTHKKPAKSLRAVTRRAKTLKNKTQKELLSKFKAYAEHKRKKGVIID